MSKEQSPIGTRHKPELPECLKKLGITTWEQVYERVCLLVSRLGIVRSAAKRSSDHGVDDIVSIVLCVLVKRLLEDRDFVFHDSGGLHVDEPVDPKTTTGDANGANPPEAINWVPFDRFVYGIARWTCRVIFRKQRKQYQAQADYYAEIAILVQSELEKLAEAEHAAGKSAKVEKYLGMLSPDERELLVLRFVHRESYLALSLIFGTSPTALRARVCRLREQVRKRYPKAE